MSGIRIVYDKITPRIKKLQNSLFKGSALMRYAVVTAVNESKKHFQEKNDLYSPLRRFYKLEGEDVVKAGTVTATHGTITVGSYKMAHKYYGGTVYATRTKFLAIPLTKPAMLRTPRQYGMGSHSPLFFCGSKNNGNSGVLIDKRSNVAVYALTRSVTHRAFKDRAMPPQKRLIDAIEKEFNKLIDKL